MLLSDFVKQVPNFDALGSRDKMRLFAWFIHTHKGIEIFDNEAIRACYRQLHLTAPDVSIYLPRMAGYSPPDLLKEKSGYKLARSVRSALDSKYGTHSSVVQISKLLAELPNRVPDLAEKAFLVEALKCYRIEAYRSCIVMTWNLAFDHIARWILKDPQRLATFNSTIPKRYPNKKPIVVIKSQDDFEELKEREVIEVCNTAGMISGSIIKILREKLDKRNTAAHPSTVIVVQSQADDVVTDLVNNVVLAII